MGPETTASTGTAPRMLVPVARRAPPLQLLPLVFVLTAGFAIAAALAPFNSQSPVGVAIQTVLFALTTGYILLAPNGDRVNAFRVASIFFVLSFCIGDLWSEPDLVWYLTHSYSNLIMRAAGLGLLCYVMMLVGYHFPGFKQIPASIPARHERVDARWVSVLSLAFFGLGVFFFVLFFGAAGGAAVILQGEDNVSRAHFGRGIGILFWPTLWMTSGSVMYFAAQLSRGRSMMFAAIPLIVEFGLLALLQGRHRALGPLLMGLAVSHYLVRPIRLPRLMLLGAAAAFFAIFVGAVRSPTIRAYAYSNPALAVEELSSDMGRHWGSLMAQDIGCIVKTMIIIDKVPTTRGYAWGQSLTIPLNPFVRLLGLDHLQGNAIGAIGYLLARPELVIDPRDTPGFLPSLAGEFRWNFPWPICAIFYMGYGALLRLLYMRLIVHRSDFASVAIYAVAGLYMTEWVFQSAAQMTFEMLDVLMPMFLIRYLSQRRPRTVGVPGRFDPHTYDRGALPPSPSGRHLARTLDPPAAARSPKRSH